MRRQRQSSPSPLALKLPDGSAADSPTQVVETFREYFHGILNGPEPSSFPTLNNRTFDSPLESVDFTIPDIKKRLRTCKPLQFNGAGQRPSPDTQGSCGCPGPRFTTLFRKCIDDGQIPTVWREATITPIYKKGSRHSPSSYRPISLTSIPCKIFERVIKEKMLQHLQSNNLVSRSQHGFLPGRSCITNMLTLMDSLTQAYDDGQISEAVFIDFSKAFDRVPHTPLLHKLKAYGFEGKLWTFLKNFLSERSFSVKVSSALSSSSSVSSGVPQGSVSAPSSF